MGTMAAQSIPSPAPHLPVGSENQGAPEPQQAVPRPPTLELSWGPSLHLVPIIHTQRHRRGKVAQLGHKASPPFPTLGAKTPEPLAPRHREPLA